MRQLVDARATRSVNTTFAIHTANNHLQKPI
jgi:hypothetical protein